jgi:hypothetical protein
MIIALPGCHTLCNDGRNGIGWTTGGMSSHQQETLIGGRITEGCGLYRIIECVGILQFPKCFLFDGAENLRVNMEATALRQTQCQDGERIVMTRKAGSLFNERRSRFLDYGQRALNGFTRVWNGLRQRSRRTEQKHRENQVSDSTD